MWQAANAPRGDELSLYKYINIWSKIERKKFFFFKKKNYNFKNYEKESWVELFIIIKVKVYWKGKLFYAAVK